MPAKYNLRFGDCFAFKHLIETTGSSLHKVLQTHTRQQRNPTQRNPTYREGIDFIHNLSLVIVQPRYAIQMYRLERIDADVSSGRVLRLDLVDGTEFSFSYFLGDFVFVKDVRGQLLEEIFRHGGVELFHALVMIHLVCLIFLSCVWRCLELNDGNRLVDAGLCYYNMIDIRTIQQTTQHQQCLPCDNVCVCCVLFEAKVNLLWLVEFKCGDDEEVQ